MRLRNSFTEETRELFRDCFHCYECGKNGVDAAHHIVGRGLGKSTLESSPLNLAVLHNSICHITRKGRAPLHAFETRARYLQKTIRFLIKNNYSLTAEDLEFYAANRKYYDYELGGEGQEG